MSENLSNHPRLRNRRASNLTPVTNGQIPRRRRRNEVLSPLPVRATRVRRFTDEVNYGHSQNNDHSIMDGQNQSHEPINPKALGIDKVTFFAHHGFVCGTERRLLQLIDSIGNASICGIKGLPDVKVFKRVNRYPNKGFSSYTVEVKRVENNAGESSKPELLFLAKLYFSPVRDGSETVYQIKGDYTINPTRIRAYHCTIDIDNPYILMWRRTPKVPLSLDGSDNWLPIRTNLRNFDRFTADCVYAAIGLVRYSINSLCKHINHRNRRNSDLLHTERLIQEPSIRLKSCECYLPIQTRNAVTYVDSRASQLKAYANYPKRDEWAKGGNSHSMKLPHYTLKMYAKRQRQARVEVNIKEISKALDSSMAYTREECLGLFRNARKYAADKIGHLFNYMETGPMLLSPADLAKLFGPYLGDSGVPEIFDILIRRGSVAKADLATTEGKQAFERFRGKPSRPNILMGLGPNRRQYRYFATPGITPPSRKRR